MAQYTVLSARKVKDVDDRGYGPMQSIALELVGPDGVTVEAEWFTKRQTGVPSPSSSLEGDVTEGPYGMKFKKAASVGYSGGGGPRPEDPKKSAAIQRMASQKAAIQVVEIATKMGFADPSVSASISPKRRHADKYTAPRPVCQESGKIAYGTRKRALTALNFLRAHATVARGTLPVAAYKCRFCGEWHHTSKEQRRAA